METEGVKPWAPQPWLHYFDCKTIPFDHSVLVHGLIVEMSSIKNTGTTYWFSQRYSVLRTDIEY